MKKIKNGKSLLLRLLAGLAAVLAAGCFVTLRLQADRLSSQQAAERWKGDGGTEFCQVTCFLPVDEELSLEQIYRFRMEILKKLHEAALDIDTDQTLFLDAWSTSGKVALTAEGGKGEAAVTAVGGEFFQFHPLRLLNGSYLSEKDLMKDLVLLDEETAWMLFGGTDLAGMPLRVNGVPFVVGGVVRREQDEASLKAYTAGRGIYMSYDAYSQLTENAGIGCYELVLAEPVKGFTLSFVQEKFPIGKGEIVSNTDRFDFVRLLGLVRQYGQRSMQTHGVVYPYWENAARYCEDWSALLAFAGVVLLILPALLLLQLLLKGLKRGKEKLTEDWIPKARDGVEEAVRKRQRKAWEKKHPGQD